MTNDDKIYKVRAWTDNRAFISDNYSQTMVKRMFVVTKGNSFDEIIPKIVEQIRREFMVKNVDFEFDIIPRYPSDVWDVMCKDDKNRFRIYIKEITNENCRVICI